MSKHLLDFKDTEKKDIEKLIDITGKINPEKVNKISSISLLKFDEPSTRTRLSFSVAAYRLGIKTCLFYTSPSPRDLSTSRMPSSA